MTQTNFPTYVAEHPKMIGAVFTLLLLLTQAGSALGAACMNYSGP